MRRTHFNTSHFFAAKTCKWKKNILTSQCSNFLSTIILKMAPTIDIRYSVWIRWLNSVSMFVGLATQQKRLFINALLSSKWPVSKENVIVYFTHVLQCRCLFQRAKLNLINNFVIKLFYSGSSFHLIGFVKSISHIRNSEIWMFEVIFIQKKNSFRLKQSSAVNDVSHF